MTAHYFVNFTATASVAKFRSVEPNYRQTTGQFAAFSGIGSFLRINVSLIISTRYDVLMTRRAIGALSKYS